MDRSENSSSTLEKARVLPQIVSRVDSPTLIIAFGTAACPKGAGHNGSVVIGSSVFVHHPYDSAPDLAKQWTHPQIDQVLASDAQLSLNRLPLAFLVLQR